MSSFWLHSRATAACPIAVEDTFGPVVSHECKNGFDFTLYFEETVLTLPVTLFFLFWALPRIYHLRQQTIKVQGGYRYFVKLV